MKETPYGTKVRLILICIIASSLLLSLTSYFLPEYLQIASVLTGIMVLFSIYFIPGKITIKREICLLITLIVIDIVSLIMLRSYCWLKNNFGNCTTSNMKATAFENIVFAAIVVGVVCITNRIRQFLNIYKSSYR